MGIINDFVNQYSKDRGCIDNLCKEIDAFSGYINSFFANDEQFVNPDILWEINQKTADLISRARNVSVPFYVSKGHLNKRTRELDRMVSSLPMQISQHNDIAVKLKHDRDTIDGICKDIDTLDIYLNSLFQKHDQFMDNELLYEVNWKTEEYRKKADETAVFFLPAKETLAKKRRVLENIVTGLPARISLHNEEVASGLVQKAREVIGNVEGQQLDEQQMRCIVKPMRNHLVIAGAGSGKTTCIVGKVKYLLNTGECKPGDILVLSFTNASASEMRDRIKKETAQDIEAMTFHKFGLNIITSAVGITPKISKIKLQEFIRNYIMENIGNPGFLDTLCNYFLFHAKYDTSEFDFRTEEEYKEYLRMNPPVTLKGEPVKSYGEMEIANFLYRNGIEYEYEKEYEVDTRTEERFQYYPDFYLPQKRIYIEYWGINANGEVPSYFTARTGKTPSEEYRAGMEWKRKTHRENGTKLIECAAYEKSNGVLLENLEKKLRDHGAEFHPTAAEEMWKRITENQSSNVITSMAETIATIISLMKANGYSIERVREICATLTRMRRSVYMLDLVQPIYEKYATALRESGEIDFNDMINMAAQLIREGRYKHSYKYVIVDEYQDISKSRYNLLSELRKISDYKLFCVGDDWQSIYRFTGSDIDYILRFSNYWGVSEYSKIETTYRFSQSLCDISGNFIMQNPYQIRKQIRGNDDRSAFAMGEIKGYNEEYAIKFMLDRLNDLPQNSSVFLIGRYTFDCKMLENCANLECHYDNGSGFYTVVFKSRRDLKIQFLTAHRSKGLQADYVFIINNKKRGMGFPSQIQDDPIINILLEGDENYPFAEERRLFYVAMTRSRIKTFLVTIKDNESVFAEEMERWYEKELKDEAYTCPRCGGHLVRRKGPYGEFFGCSNYSSLGCKYTKPIKKMS